MNPSPTPPIIKRRKEFTTYWSQENVATDVHSMPLAQQRFFDRYSGTQSDVHIVVPCGITYGDLLGFVGKKTKVTIEVIPE